MLRSNLFYWSSFCYTFLALIVVGLNFVPDYQLVDLIIAFTYYPLSIAGAVLFFSAVIKHALRSDQLAN